MLVFEEVERFLWFNSDLKLPNKVRTKHLWQLKIKAKLALSRSMFYIIEFHRKFLVHISYNSSSIYVAFFPEPA